jgi:hypothetical protein
LLSLFGFLICCLAISEVAFVLGISFISKHLSFSLPLNNYQSHQNDNKSNVTGWYATLNPEDAQYGLEAAGIETVFAIEA